MVFGVSLYQAGHYVTNNRDVNRQLKFYDKHEALELQRLHSVSDVKITRHSLKQDCRVVES